MLTANAVGDFITFTVPAIAAGSYNVRVGVKKYYNRGSFQLAAARSDSSSFSNIGVAQDLYSAAQSYTELDLGTWSPVSASDKLFRFTVSGKSAASSGYVIAIDYIRLLPQ